MQRIFKRFELDLEEMAKLNDKKQSKLPEAIETLRKELLSKGYEILESNSYFHEVPKSIIISGEIGMQHSTDFYTIAEKLGLKFKSEDYFYAPVNC